MTRATGGKWDDLITKLNTNPSLSDIDYAYAVFGVSLNAKEPAAQSYVWEFFQDVMLGLDLTGAAYTTWKTAWTAAKNTQGTHDAWVCCPR